jgi:hypothetical protein
MYFETIDDAFNRFEQVGEHVIARYDAFGRLVHMDVKRISTDALGNGTHIEQVTETTVYRLCMWDKCL